MWVIGFPKSGNTWISFLFAYTLNSPYDDADEPGIHPRKPEQRALVKGGLSHRSFEAVTGPVLKTHTLERREERPIVYVVRDGRDVMISYLFYVSRYRGRRRGTGARLRSLLAPPRTSLASVISQRARLWSTHVDTWLQRGPDVVIRYEDMQRDGFGTMRSALAELHTEVDDDVVRRALDEFSFERQSGRTPGNEDPASFFRKGIVGDWRNHFTEEHERLFMQEAGETLRSLGYLA